jgi:hypothetical protein
MRPIKFWPASFACGQATDDTVAHTVNAWRDILNRYHTLWLADVGLKNKFDNSLHGLLGVRCANPCASGPHVHREGANKASLLPLCHLCACPQLPYNIDLI